MNDYSNLICHELKEDNTHISVLGSNVYLWYLKWEILCVLSPKIAFLGSFIVCDIFEILHFSVV